MPNNTNSILRAIDANINRTQEALCVVEDCLRFVIEDSHLTKVCKNLRHEFTTWSAGFDKDDLLAMRNAGNDVGHTTHVSTEYQRSGVEDILQANLSRAEQSLRTLEEFSKTTDIQFAIGFERIRYRVYDLEKALLMLLDSSDRLNTSRLYVLTDGCGGIRDFCKKVHSLVDSGVDVIQLRHKTLDDRSLQKFAEALVETTRPHGVCSIINDRVDIAMAANANGVHLGQNDLPVEEARRIAGPKMLIGVSTHNLQQAREAVIAGANYIGVGPTFASSTKQFSQFTGVGLLREVASEITLPAFAIGGISLDNLREVLDSGIRRVAIAGSVPNDPSSISDLILKFKQQLNAETSEAQRQ